MYNETPLYPIGEASIHSNIVFLGTGADSYVVGKQQRAGGGILLQFGDDQFHIDPGPGSLNSAYQSGINIRANTALFVTINQLYHANDINAIIDVMTHSGFDKKGVLVAGKSLFSEDSFLRSSAKQYVERVIMMHPGKRIGINQIEIEALKTSHPDEQSIGLRFHAPEFVVCYSGDTRYTSEVATQYEKADILILNVPYLHKDDGKDGLCKDDAIKIISRVMPKVAIITHFGTSFLKADPLYEIREIQKITGCQVIAAKDGMVFNSMNYSVEYGQKTLYKFSGRQGIRVHETLEIQQTIESTEKQTTLDNQEDDAIADKASDA